MKALKEKLILSFMERKKKKEPFDVVGAETYQLSPDADINQNNSHFFTASSASGETLSIRLGMRNGSEFEVFVLYRSPDDRFFCQEKDSYKPEECPVSFECIEAGKRWKMYFKGQLRDAAGNLNDAEIAVEFTDELPIYDFFYSVDRFTGMARSIAREKWNRKFFDALSRNNQRHYEQPGRISGTVLIAGERFEIDLCCVRDHSFGCREWDMMNDHIWMLGVTDNDKVLSFSIVNYPSLKRIYSGYTNFFSDKLESLRDYEILEYDAAGGAGPETLRLKCIFPEGKCLEVSVRRDCCTLCRFDGGKYVFQEGLGAFKIGGCPGRGTIEYGYNGNPSRWEGYSKID